MSVDSYSTWRLAIATCIIAAITSCLVACAAVSDANQRPHGARTPAISDLEVVRNYGKLPLRFEANLGQTDGRVKFLARGKGFGLFLTAREAVLALHKSVAGTPSERNQDKSDAVRMQFAGADGKAKPEGLNPLQGTSNYMLGDDPTQWHTNVPNYARVRYAGVYPGVDLVYYGNEQQLEFDFLVAPGASPSSIRLHFEGARELKLNHGGDLVIEAGDGAVAFHRPVVYQMVHGIRRQVNARFILEAGKSAGVELGGYDRKIALVIDPTLVYSTYLGGSNSDQINAIAVDSSGAAYLTGTTASTDYPATPGVFQTAFETAFVTKLNASGTALVYSTFLGGSASSAPPNVGNSIAVDSSGNAYVTGTTSSANFPVTTGAFQSHLKATSSGSSGFVTKINSTGTKLIYSTYLGGSTSEGADSLVLDSSGNVYIAGFTYSKDFPTTAGVVQSTNNSYSDSGWNEYVAKLNPTGSELLYATCLGGSGDYGEPEGIRLAVDGSGDAFVTATVLSTDFPVTSGGFQKASNAKSGYANMTVAKLNSTATKLLYSSYLGGHSSSGYGDDLTNGLAVDSADNAYLAGVTYDTDYPVTAGAYQVTNRTTGSGASTGFITKMNSTGSALSYSTYLGGSGQATGDRLFALALDSAGDVYVTGTSGSADYPVTSNAYQRTDLGNAVAVLTEMNPTGNALLYSTYFGGPNSYDDTGYGIALGSNGAVYMAGIATGPGFPITAGAYESVFESQNFETGFVAELTLGSAPTTQATAIVLTSSANPAGTGSNLTFSASVYPTTGTGIPAGSVTFNIDQVNVATIAINSKGYADYSTTIPLALGQHAILASYPGNSTYSASGGNITQNITSATPILSPAGGIYPSAQLVTIADKTAGATIYYSTDGSAPTSSSIKYTGPIMVSTSEFISAVAVIVNAPDSATATASYQFLTAPTVLAVPAASIGTAGATLNALVNTFGMTGTFQFQYGTSSSALTSTTPITTLSQFRLGSRLSFAPLEVSFAVGGLSSKTTYYYQIVITTPAGSSSGEVLSFATN